MRVLKGLIKRTEIALKDVEIRLGGLFFDRPEPRTRPLDHAKIQRILLLRHDKLGDMAVTIPALETIKKNLPQVAIDILASPRNVALVKNDSRLDNVFLYCKRPFKDFATLREIRRRNYDLVLDMICHDSVTSVFLSQYLGRRCLRSALGKTRLGQFYHFHLPVDIALAEHMLDVTLKSLWPLGITPERFFPHAPLHFSAGTASRVDDIIRSLEARAGRPCKFAGVNISAGASNRWWGEENFAEFLRLFAQSAPEYQALLLSTPEDRDRALRVCALSACDPLMAPPGLDIMTVAGVISRLDLLVTPDTSLTHIARNFEVPVVGLYSAHERNTAQWRPYGQKRGLVQGGHVDDIFDITAARALEETLEMLKRIEHVAV